MAEAATVPIAYATAYYALVVRGGLTTGKKVLIHSGSGAVGQAAIAVALGYDCDVFVTVGSVDKRQYLKTRFPRLKDENMGNSRDLSFEWHIMSATHGRGVDLVLNSLSKDKLHASLRVLSLHGSFLEIGKYDICNDAGMGMIILLKYSKSVIERLISLRTVLFNIGCQWAVYLYHSPHLNFLWITMFA